MKQYIFLVLLTIFTSRSFSQESVLSVEAAYPLLVDDNYYGREFNGVIDLGAKYRFAETGAIKLGAAVNGGLLTNNSNRDRDLSDFKITSFLLQPKVFAELAIPGLHKFHPFAGAGYSFLFSKVTGTVMGLDAATSNTRSGINLNLGACYDLTNSIFIQVQYDYLQFTDDEEMPNDPFIATMNILKVGLGLRLERFRYGK